MKNRQKIAGYHQFHAVREILQATIAAANPTGNKSRWFGIPKVQVKVFRCVAMQVNFTTTSHAESYFIDCD